MVAPDAVSVVFVPAQIVDCVAEVFTTGGGLTVTVTDADPLQVPVVPVTVYVVVVAGETESEDPLLLPGCQV